jgi:hypothetical protein
MSIFVEKFHLLKNAEENKGQLIDFFYEYVSQRKGTISTITREFLKANDVASIRIDLMYCLYLILAREAVE